VVLVLDLFGLRVGAKAPDVDVGLHALVQAVSAGDGAARLVADLLDEEIGLRDDVRRASRLALLAVLRHFDARGSLHGVRAFAARAADGELLTLLQRLGDQPRAGRR